MPCSMQPPLCCIVKASLTPHLHRLLLDMFDERQLADYSGAGFDEERVIGDYQHADEFVAAVREYLEKQGEIE